MDKVKVNGGMAEIGVTPLIALGANMRNEPIMCGAKLLMYKGDLCSFTGKTTLSGVNIDPKEYIIDTPKNRKAFRSLIKGKGLKEANDAINSYNFD